MTADTGTTLYRAYIGLAPGVNWIETADVSGVVVDGKPLLRMHGRSDFLVAWTDDWKRTRAEAQWDIHAALVREIGRQQAKADELRDTLMHASLCDTEAA
jgi:hypothetical protein